MPMDSANSTLPAVVYGPGYDGPWTQLSEIMRHNYAANRGAPVVVTPGGGYGRDIEQMLAIRYETLRTLLVS